MRSNGIQFDKANVETANKLCNALIYFNEIDRCVL